MRKLTLSPQEHTVPLTKGTSVSLNGGSKTILSKDTKEPIVDKVISVKTGLKKVLTKPVEVPKRIAAAEEGATLYEYVSGVCEKLMRDSLSQENVIWGHTLFNAALNFDLSKCNITGLGQGDLLKQSISNIINLGEEFLQRLDLYEPEFNHDDEREQLGRLVYKLYVRTNQLILRERAKAHEASGERTGILL